MPVERPLGHLRVLELPGLEPAFCGKLFADLGADVLKIEPPGGDPVRQLGPFVPNAAGEPVSATWLSYSLGKRFATLDLALPPGRAAFDELVTGADVLIHGLPHDAAAASGLSYERLAGQNPGLVVVSITPFGSTGPYANWRGSDIVHLGMGGYLHMTGPEFGRPIKPSAPIQTYLHAGNHAFAAALLALRRRSQTGEGAFVDQSIRDTATWMLTHTYQHWDMLGINLRRQGSGRDMGSRKRLKSVYRSSDGYVAWMFTTGHLGARANEALVRWMAAEGMAPAWLQELDWYGTDLLNSTPDMVERMESTFGAFYASHSGQELLEFAIEHGLMMAPCNSVADVAADPQLAARDAWRTLDHPELGTVRIPGPPIRIGGVTWGVPPVSEPGAAAGWLAARATPPGSASAAGSPPLRPRVLDFGTTLAAPVVGRHLADFGFDVIKVESQTHPDTLRVGTPYAGGVAGIDRSGYFAAYNAGKRSFALNLQAEGALDVVRRLVEHADVLLENFAPGVMTRLGLTWERLHEWNPRLILASHSLQGQTGPRSRHRGYGQVASAMTGWYDLTGEEGGEPLGPYSAYTDFLSWPFLLSAILVALEARESTGEGMRIDHAQVESSLQFLAPLLLQYERTSVARTRCGNAEFDAAPNNAYPCRDNHYIAISVENDAQFESLRALLRLPSDPRFATADGRHRHHAELDALIDAATAERDPLELAAELQAERIAAGHVARASDLFADPQLLHRGFFRRLQHEEMGEHAVLTQSFRISGIEAGPWIAAPRLGEHTYDVATGLLGLSGDEVADLMAAGVLQ